MTLNRREIKRSLQEKTKSFIATNRDEIEAFLAPAMDAFDEEIQKLGGPRGRVIELSFRESAAAWEKFFWASFGQYWIVRDLSLELALAQAEEELMGLSNVLETVVVLEKLEVVERNPSITTPISLQVDSLAIIASEEIDELTTLDPTEELDLEHPRISLPMAKEGSLGTASMDQMRLAGPEETTVVEGIRGRPKVAG